MKLAATLCFLVAAAINLAPVAGVFSAERMAALYGIPIAEPTLEILMRHRAVLFGIVGALLALAAFRPEHQTVAAAAGFVSMLSFVAIAWLVGDVSPALRRIAVADVIGSVALALGLLLRR
jgi:riboflavin transporter FmnP